MNYFQNRNSSSRSVWNQNGCRKWRRAEEKTTGGSGQSHDQEAGLMVLAASLQGTVEELAVDGRGRKRKRRKSAEGGVHCGCSATSEGLGWWRRWCSSRWLVWWWPKVTAERERRERTCCRKTGEGKQIFSRFCTRFSSCLGHEIHPYL